MMLYRKLNLESDYPVLKTLWEKSKMKLPPPMDMLPADGIVAVREGGDIVGAVFMWLATNSVIAFIGFPVLDVDYLEDDRVDLLEELFNKAETVSMYLGFKYAKHYSGLPYMTKFMEGRGYFSGDVDVVDMVKVL